jgi:hypothetical protein
VKLVCGGAIGRPDAQQGSAGLLFAPQKNLRFCPYNVCLAVTWWSTKPALEKGEGFFAEQKASLPSLPSSRTSCCGPWSLVLAVGMVLEWHKIDDFGESEGLKGRYVGDFVVYFW